MIKNIDKENNEQYTIDHDEINKFNKTMFEWWDKDGEFKMLHQINPLRVNYLKEKICQYFLKKENNIAPLKGVNILDVGSGGGLVSVALNKLGAKVTGLDANEHNVAAAKEYAKQEKLQINYVESTIENYVEQYQEKYDVVVCLEVIEHVARPAIFIEKICQLVKKDGLLIISTLNRNIKSYLLAIIMAEYVLGWVPKKTHHYNKFIRPSELNSMFTPENWQLLELKGLNFSPLTQSWILSEDIKVNYFAIFKNS